MGIFFFSIAFHYDIVSVMKKLFFLIAFSALFTFSTFARIEISPRLFVEFLNTDYSTTGYNEKISLMNFGAEIQGQFFLTNAGIFDFGLFASLDAGGGTFKVETEAESIVFALSDMFVETTSESISNAQFSLGASLAPAIQMNIGYLHSIYISPGFIFTFIRRNFSDGDTSKTLSYSIPEFTAEAGYKLWLWEKIALTAGYRYALPLSILTSDSKIEFDSASAHRFFLGISWKVLQ